MAGRRRSPLTRRLVMAIGAVTLMASGLLTSPTPAAAAKIVPWRFTQVVVNSSISGYSGAEPIKGWTLQCPAGYFPASGGIVGGDATHGIYRLLEYPNPVAGTYHISARNSAISGTTITLAANCVWLDDVGPITTVATEFARNGSGRAGGIVYCPEGMTVLGGGVDWSNFSSGRNIAYSTPVGGGDGLAAGWYGAGYSDVAGVLAVEVHCVSSTLVSGEYFEADDSTAGAGTRTAKAICTTGYRILTGGVAPAVAWNPGVDQGKSSLSGPLDYRQWPVQGYVPAGVALRAFAVCVPKSTVSAAFTQTPAALSTAPSGTITFVVSDSAGNSVTDRCYLDGIERGCTSGTPVSYGPLVDGDHSFQVIAQNQTESVTSITHDWTIDATEPLISQHAPTTALSVTGPLTIDFSEPVEGVTTSSVTVHAESANVNIAGTISRPDSDTAMWSPTGRLVPGETYRVSFTSAIQDVAGNALVPTFFNVRATTTVDNVNAALERYWDLDPSGIASGGSYIVSRLAGTRADMTFTATAGQTVSVYGIRLPNGGNADVYVDGVKKATASFYAASTTRAQVYVSGALSAGPHTISIRPLGTKPAGSSGTWVAIDNVNVGATVKQESSLTQGFRRDSNANAYQGSYDLAIQSTDADPTPARFRLTFVGTGVKLYATKTPTSGKARIYIDGVLMKTIDLKAASTTYKALVYSAAVAMGQHQIRIEAVGGPNGDNSAINVDRIAIN